VGGLGLTWLGSSESTCDVTIVKNVYYPGELVDVAIECDNSKCNSAVASFTVKLYRVIRCRNVTSGHFEDTVSLVSQMEEGGCAAGAKETRAVQFEIPESAEDPSSDKDRLGTRTSRAVPLQQRTGGRVIHADEDDEDAEKRMAGLTGSWLGAVFQVQYLLKVYIKHEGMFEFGAGRSVTLPLKILNTPTVSEA
jgi:hypothetical protein